MLDRTIVKAANDKKATELRDKEVQQGALGTCQDANDAANSPAHTPLRGAHITPQVKTIFVYN